MSEIGKLIHIFSIHAYAPYRGSRRYFHFACLTREERNPPSLRVEGWGKVVGAVGAKDARARARGRRTRGKCRRCRARRGREAGRIDAFHLSKAAVHVCATYIQEWHSCDGISQFSEACWSATEASSMPDRWWSRSKRTRRARNSPLPEVSA